MVASKLVGVGSVFTMAAYDGLEAIDSDVISIFG